MGWRVLHISKANFLRIRHANLLIERYESEPIGDKETIEIPLDDIAAVVLDNFHFQLTGSLLSELAERNIALIVSDKRHLPVGLLCSWQRHHLQPTLGWLQTELGQPFKKRLWQRIVASKLANQAEFLRKISCPQFSRLGSLSQKVKSGDPENLEAQGAKLYWQTLFTNFKRADKSDRRNALLNYGYAVTRATLARSCAGFGLLPMFGLHHASRSNPFNLVDDLIEPFRISVDYRAFMRLQSVPEQSEMDLEDRRYMVCILESSVKIGDEIQTLLNACDTITISLIQAFKEKNIEKLKLPSPIFSDLEAHAR